MKRFAWTANYQRYRGPVSMIVSSRTMFSCYFLGRPPIVLSAMTIIVSVHHPSSVCQSMYCGHIHIVRPIATSSGLRSCHWFVDSLAGTRRVETDSSSHRSVCELSYCGEQQWPSFTPAAVAADGGAARRAVPHQLVAQTLSIRRSSSTGHTSASRHTPIMHITHTDTRIDRAQ